MRIKIEVEGDRRYAEKSFSFFINDFPGTPHEGDLIDLTDFVNESEFTEQQLQHVDALSFNIEYVVWRKDEKGIFLEILCHGD